MYRYCTLSRISLLYQAVPQNNEVGVLEYILFLFWELEWAAESLIKCREKKVCKRNYLSFLNKHQPGRQAIRETNHGLIIQGESRPPIDPDSCGQRIL